MALQEAARDITGLGGVAVLSFLTLTVSSLLMLEGKRRMALFVLCSVISEWPIVEVRKIARSSSHNWTEGARGVGYIN